MKIISVCLMLAAASAAVFSYASAAADVDCSGTKRSKSAPYREVIQPRDWAGHEMRQAIRTHLITSSNPDFDGAEQTVFAHEDGSPQSGTSIGYFLYTLKNGEKIWAKFDSVYWTKGPKDAWEVTYQGVFRFVGGTGRYAGIHGGGAYGGKITAAAGFEESFTCSADYGSNPVSMDDMYPQAMVGPEPVPARIDGSRLAVPQVK